MSTESLISGRNIHIQEIEYNTPLTDSDCVDYSVIITSDKKKFKVPRKVVQMSEVIKDILLTHEGVGVEIPVEVDSQTMALVFEYIQQHSDDENISAMSKPLRKKFKDVVSSWDYEFCTQKLLRDGDDIAHAMLFKVLKAASSLLIVRLKDLCCAFVASMVIGKTDADVRSLFNVTEDITESDEKMLQEKYPWLREKI